MTVLVRVRRNRILKDRLEELGFDWAYRVVDARSSAGGRRECGLAEPDGEGKGAGGEQETDDEQLVEDAGSHCLVL